MLVYKMVVHHGILILYHRITRRIQQRNAGGCRNLFSVAQQGEHQFGLLSENPPGDLAMYTYKVVVYLIPTISWFTHPINYRSIDYRLRFLLVIYLYLMFFFSCCWYTNPSEKYDFVNWDNDFQLNWNIKRMFQTTNHILMGFSGTSLDLYEIWWDEKNNGPCIIGMGVSENRTCC